MPTYIYRCTEGHEAPKIFRMAEKPDITQCGISGCMASARSVPVPAPIHLKGSGWGRG